jgi:adenosylcobinamide-GDP ribazoletransferase
MRAFLAALGFLTRIPVPVRVFGDARAAARSLAWYPVVGLLLGVLLAALAWCLREAAPSLCAALLLTAWVALTGGLHLDGLADSADAWIGGLGDRERTLAIMQDPRSGPAGVTAVVLALLLKFAALASAPPAGWATLWLAPLLARAAVVALFLLTPYVRRGGLGEALRHAPCPACALALAGSALVCIAAGWRGAWMLAAVAAVFVLWRRACLRRLGGCTGDTAGALVEMAEAAALVVSVLA